MEYNMKEKTEKFTKYLLITLLIIMPILDMRFFFSRVTTLTEVLIILFCLLLTLITNKTSRKNFIKLFIYYCILLYVLSCSRTGIICPFGVQRY